MSCLCALRTAGEAEGHWGGLMSTGSQPSLPLALPGMLNKNQCKTKHSNFPSLPSILSLREVFGTFPLGVITSDSLIQTLLLSL